MLLDKARQDTVDRMVEDAVTLEADAIVGIIFSSSSLMQRQVIFSFMEQP
jgi:uncharacterized protein YbjQ (UPF0145 family)